MTRLTRRTLLIAAATTLGLGLAACSSGTTTGSPSASTATSAATATSASASPSVDVKALTVTPGKLTIATGKPAYSPWVENDKPETGEGYEAAVAYAVAEQLGFAKTDVVWKRTTFDQAIAPGPKDWDFNLQQFSITDQRKKAVDFSTPYYTTTQAIVTYKGSPIADATTLAALKAAKLGVQVGTTSQQAAAKVVSAGELSVFNTNEDAVQALKGKQVQGLVVDLPTALYLAAAEIDNGKIIGTLPDSAGGDQFGLVLAKGSKLTAPVSAAVDALRTNGTLATLEKKWLSESISVPVLA